MPLLSAGQYAGRRDEEEETGQRVKGDERRHRGGKGEGRRGEREGVEMEKEEGEKEEKDSGERGRGKGRSHLEAATT